MFKSLLAVGSFQSAAATCVCGSRYPTCDSDGLCYDHHSFGNQWCGWLNCCNHMGNGPCTASFGEAPPAPPPPPPPPPPATEVGRLCLSAYEHQCYDRGNFQQCCSVCNGGQSSFQCDWYYSDRVTDCEDCGGNDIRDSFIWEAGQERVCELACGALGGELNNARHNNHFLEYCPGGAIWQAVQPCPAANASLARLVPPSLCPHYDGAESCTWEHHKVLNGATDHTSNITISGTFQFTAGDANCKQACAQLGSADNSPTAYCEHTVLSSALQSSCYEAVQSVNAALAQESQWCAEDTELAAIPNRAGSAVKKVDSVQSDPVAPRSLRSAEPVMLAGDDECSQAWDHQCYNHSDDWRNCCHQCDHIGHAHLSCHWDYTGPRAVHVSGDFEYQVYQSQCNTVCSHLALPSNMPRDFCPGGRIYELANNCPPAQHNLQQAVQGTELCNMGVAPRLDLAESAQTLQMPVMAACAGIAALVAFAAAFMRPQRRNGSEGHSQHLLESH